MDYEKAYKAVLKTATQWIKDGCTDKEKICLECVFPELRESEDERIIRAIIDALYSHTNSINLLSSRGYQMENIEAWLEKQKYDRMKPIYDARESFESALGKAWNDYHNGYENVDKFEDDYVECAHAKGFREGYLFGIEKQKEQKSAWSEEDEKMRNLAIEWAETMSGQFRFVDMDSTDFRKIVAWLKSLRPRPSWKPSEEHLSALLAVFNDPNNIGSQTCQLALTDLYEQLKKL